MGRQKQLWQLNLLIHIIIVFATDLQIEYSVVIRESSKDENTSQQYWYALGFKG